MQDGYSTGGGLGLGLSRREAALERVRDHLERREGHARGHHAVEMTAHRRRRRSTSTASRAPPRGSRARARGAVAASARPTRTASASSRPSWRPTSSSTRRRRRAARAGRSTRRRRRRSSCSRSIAGPACATSRGAWRDGYSTAGSPGTGLGAVRRLSDDFDIYSTPGRGTAVLARVCARSASPAQRDRRVRRSAASRVPMPGEAVCGDAWHVRQYADRRRSCSSPTVWDTAPLPARPPKRRVRAHSSASRSRCEPLDALEAMHDGDAPHARRRGGDRRHLTRDAACVRFAGVGNICGAVCLDGHRPPGGVAQRHARPRGAAVPRVSVSVGGGRACSSCTPTA